VPRPGMDFPRGERFPPTRWSQVLLAATREATAERQGALADLCGSYWDPLYAFARHMGYSADDARDLTQGFFAVLLEKEYLQEADRKRGKFRSFLLAAFKHYIANENDRARARKRGGGQTPLAIEPHAAEEWYRAEPADDRTPEKIFELRWALTVLHRALARVRAEYAARGQREYFAHLEGVLMGEERAIPYGRIAAELGTSEGALRVAAHRLRQRFRAQLRSEVGQTLADPQQADEEIRYLLAAVGRRG